MARALRERGSDGRAKPVVQINKEYLKAGLDAPGPEDPAPGARVRSGRAGKQEYWQAHKKWFLTTFNAKDSVLKKRWLDKLWEQLPQASKDEYEKAAKGGKNKRVHRGWPPPHTNDGIIPLPGATKLPDVVRDNEVPIIDVGSGRATREEPFFPKIHAHEKRMAELPTGVDGRWVRKKHLGEGGFGTVSAWQKVTNDDGHHVDTMAVKDIDYDDKWFNTTAWAKDVLLPDGLKAKLPTEVYMHRIMQAAKSSPYIVNYRGYRVNDNLRTVRITQDLASGGSLRDLVRKNETKFLPPHYLHYVFLALVLACRKLEERAVVHRDLKMQNVVLDHSNFDDQMEGEDAKTLNAGGWGFRAQVCDFGLAMEEECEALINPTDYRGCTPGCQAPVRILPPKSLH
ncbi:kinase-like protein [Tothia fuscella]|uniref:Kinase-like protein n=1 Tax=Tothia fuscella TaxID=1048955 RepID=A0A9P4NJE8_9PEZI|nr:kinase-like protein [Tothia fuscella]